MTGRVQQGFRGYTLQAARLLMLLSGAAIILRAALGPFKVFVPVNSPLTAETVFALSFLWTLLSNGPGWIAFPSAPVPKWAIFAVAGLVALCFLRTLPSSFVSDDFVMLKLARELTPARLAYHFWPLGSVFLRPVTDIVIAAESRLAGLDPVAWHSFSLATHVANCMLVYLLGGRLFPASSVGVTAATLFGIDGAQPEAVSFAVAMGDLLATLFVLLGLVLFLKYCESGSRSVLAASLASLLAALGSKEPAFIFPLLACLCALRVGTPLAATIPHWILTGAAFVYRWAALGGMGGYSGVHTTVLGAAKALAVRVWAILAFSINWSVQPEWWLAAAVVLGIGAYVAISFAPPARRDVALPLAWTVLSAATGTQMLLIGQDLLNSRLLYLPSVGFALTLGAAIDHLAWQRWWTAGALALFFGLALQHNLSIWNAAAEEASQFCDAAAAGTSTAPPPRSLNGVYFFANGFPECIELRKEAQSRSAR